MENIYLAVKNKNDNIRSKSASGGIFSLIAEYVLQNKGVVYGVALSDDFTSAKHIRITEEKNLQKIRGSKYVQSVLGDTFNRIKSDLSDGKLVLFSGTPCQAKALRTFIKDDKNLIICDIVCHGVASPKIFKDYMEFLQSKNGDIDSFFFRAKEKGWSNQCWRVTYKNSKVDYSSSELNSFKNIYYKHVVHRPSCFKCPFTTVDRTSDFTLGDFWGLEKVHSDFIDQLGVSLLIVHNEKALDIWDKIKSETDFITCKKEDCLQPQLVEPVEYVSARDDFWKDVNSGSSYKTLAHKYGYPSILRRIKRKVVNVIKGR